MTIKTNNDELQLLPSIPSKLVQLIYAKLPEDYEIVTTGTVTDSSTLWRDRHEIWHSVVGWNGADVAKLISNSGVYAVANKKATISAPSQQENPVSANLQYQDWGDF